ncbi:lysosomal-trafficking regulator-like isoform X3 [Scleropages formosus]|uniref:lysosomal-trafficking regulator-like isoform X3 n=1 Tax=Scleropages formosus TaxID=113540 RepID=UPI0010FA6522|nr:lysosomal-trafficking regulator isoform X3 [Scleropages formosus]
MCGARLDTPPVVTAPFQRPQTKNVLKFWSDMASASNFLAREFLTDIHQLCSEVAQLAEVRGAEAEEEEDEGHMAALGSYLIQGRGLRLLRTLDCVISQELTCREELLTLLLSLLPLVWRIPMPEGKAPDFSLPSLAKVLDQGRNVALLGSGRRKTESDKQRFVKLSSGLRKSRRQCKARRRCPAGKGSKSLLSTSDSGTSSDDKSIGHGGRHWRSHRPNLQVDRLLRKRAVVAPISTSDVAQPLLPGSETQTYMFGTLSILEGRPCSSLDLCHVLLSLMEKVCRFDTALNRSINLVDRVVPVLTEILTEFAERRHGFAGGEDLTEGWTEEPIALIQRMLLRAVLRLMSTDAGKREALPEHLRRSLLGLMEAILKQARHSPVQPRKGLQEAQDIVSSSACWHCLLVLPELLEGMLRVLLDCLQASVADLSSFQQVVKLIHEFVQRGGLELSGTSILVMESLCTEEHVARAEASECSKGLVYTILKIISAMKQATAEQLHQATCLRHRHHHCEYAFCLGHHRDVSGLPMPGYRQTACSEPCRDMSLEGKDGLYTDGCCILSACAHQCLCLLPLLPSSSPASLQILAGLQLAGICCCMEPWSVVAPLLDTLRASSPNAHRSRVLNLLSWLLLEQLGGARLPRRRQRDSCSICSLNEHHLFLLEKTTQGRCTGDEHSFTSPTLPNLGAEGGALHRWGALEAYRDLVFHEDPQLGLLAASHVCHLLLRGNAAVQLQLGIHVLTPVLQSGVALARYTRELSISTVCSQASSFRCQGLSVDVLQVFMRILPGLLRFRVIRDLFLCCNGLQQVLELMYLHPVRLPALRVFEILILSVDHVTETQTLGVTMEEADRTGLCVARKDSSNLRKVYEDLTETHLPKMALGTDEARPCPSDVHLSAINLFLCVAFMCVSKEADSDRDSANDSEDTSGYDSTASEPLGSRPPCLPPDSVALPPKDQLWRVADVWSMCHKIYLSSPTFQSQFFRLGGFKVCSRLMTMVIQKLALKTREGRTKKRREFKVKGSPCQSHQDLNNLVSGIGDTDLQCPGDSPSPGQTGVKSKDQFKKLEEEWPLHCIQLLEALLAMCLHNSKSSTLLKMEPELSVQSVEDMLGEVREQLSLSGLVSSDLAAPLFDALLRVSLTRQSSFPDLTVEEAARIHGKTIDMEGDLSDVMDKPQNTSAWLPGEEEGYEGDSETNPEDNGTREEGATAETSCLEKGVVRAMSEDCCPVELFYPEVCSMVLHLLSTGSPELQVLSHALAGLLPTIHSNPSNAALLYQQGAMKTILEGFHDILSHADPSSQECLAVLVDLLAAMASVSVTAEELVLLLRLFLQKKPPAEILLRGILHIVEANIHPEPLQFLFFPLLAEPCTPGSTSPGLQHSGIAGGRGPGLHFRGILPRNCSGADREMSGCQWTSPWNLAPIQLPLVGQNCWPHMADGFSASLWLRTWAGAKSSIRTDRNEKPHGNQEVPRDSAVDSTGGEKSPKMDRLSPPNTGDSLEGDTLVHVISLGSKALMLQVWADLPSGTFQFRVCFDPNDETKACLLAKAESPAGLLAPGRWQHLALTYTERPETKRTIQGSLELWVCGVRKCEISLDYTRPRKSSIPSDSSKTCCMLGHELHPAEDQHRLGAYWDIGNLLLFNGSRIGSEEALYLYASGPDFISIMPCKFGKPSVRFSKYVTEEVLESDQILELLLKNKEVDTCPLAESLAVVYTSSCPAYYTIYEPIIRLKGLPKVVATQRPYSVKEVQSPVFKPHSLKAMSPCEPQILNNIVHHIGGTSCFLFLFARVVELCDSERTQALALKVLLTLVRYNQHRIQEMDSCHGYAMIRQVLLKSKCIVGYHMLKTLLDGCCSEPILIVGEDGQFCLDAESTALLQDLQLLSEVMLDWKVWSKAQAQVWATLLAALEVLIRAHHPQKMFNIGQLLKAQVVQRFLLTCQVLQEHQNENLTFIPQDVCLSFVRIIEEVLGSPPDLELLRLIYNFLLAMHPDNNTFVCHTPASFYFSLHIDGKPHQEKTVRYVRQASNRGQSARSSIGSLSLAGHDEGLDGERQPVESQIEGHFPKLPSFQRAEEECPVADLVESSTETLRSTGSGQLLSSCESAKTVCDSNLHIPTEEKLEEDALIQPEMFNGNQPLQRSQSNFSSLGLAFPTQNSSVGHWSSLADHGRLPEQSENFIFSPEFDSTDGKTDRCSTEDCLIMVCCGLYDLLRSVLLILPDLMLEEVVDKLIRPEALIVLVNHFSPLVQQAVMKLLDTYFSRAFREQKDKFLKNHGFSLLANQLYRHQGTQGLLQCCLEMVFGRPVSLEQDVNLADLEKVSSFRKRCVIPLLGLVEGSLSNSTLVHSVLCALMQLFSASSKVADILLDHGLLYVVLNTVATLSDRKGRVILDEHKVLLCDLQQLLMLVTVHSCRISGAHYFHIFEELIILLSHLQTSKTPGTHEIAIALQFHVLQGAFKFITSTVRQNLPTKMNSSDVQPMAQDHLIYQQRRNSTGRQRISPTHSELLTRMHSAASDELVRTTRRRMSEESPLCTDEGELTQRLQKLVGMAVDRLIYLEDYVEIPNFAQAAEQSSDLDTPVESTVEDNSSADTLGIVGSFQKEIFKLLIEGINTGLGSSGKSVAPKQQVQRILWLCQDVFRVQFGRLLVHSLSPTQPLKYRRLALEIVYKSNHPDMLREYVCSSSEYGPKLALHLQELLTDHKENLTEEDQLACTVFVTSLKLCGHSCIPPKTPSKPESMKVMKEDQLKYELEEKTSKATWEKKNEPVRKSLMQQLDSKLKDISRIAADLTQAISQARCTEKKKLIQHISSLYKLDLAAEHHWQQLIRQLTHDRAVWFDQPSYPTSWQLDPTEGPNRERRRLQRCYLTIPNKYLLKDRRKPEELVKPPLSFLFEDRSHSFSSRVKDKATTGQIRCTVKCISVAPSRETSGELLLGNSAGMYFVEDNTADTFDSEPHGEMEPASFSWTYEEIKEVHKRWWQLRDNAVEIFLTNGRTLLLAFDNTKSRDTIYQNILSCNLPNLLECGNISALTHLWSSGQITNFEYLTHLNKHAGRSFNDLMQYPVFPFILSDYNSEALDLHDPSIYRNLSKPIAVQSKEKENRYVDNYKYLEEEFRKGVHEDDPMPPVQPYHYGSHYSNSGTVLHFLVRMPPFTQMFLTYQDQSFDIPDRTFHSMNTTWRLSSYESMTDVKELIPEFFYLPEFLVNREGFDFGVRQNSERVNHVNLPPWARSDPRLFILIHRQALESDLVSQTLCQWIDLVFGIKQKGKAAVQAVNVFHPATYFGVDVSAVEDPVQQRALETMIKTYGQTPRQLFNTTHVGRTTPRPLMEGELPAAMGLLVQLAFRESRDHPKDTACPSPLPWIRGLKWGEYVGSPSTPDPVVCFSQPHGEHFDSLQALPTRAICGFSRRVCLMMVYSKEQGVRNMHSTDIKWSAIVSWGHTDHTLRLKSKQSEPPVSFIQCSQLYPVTSCAWVADSCQLFTGSKCGVITAYSTRFTCSSHSEMEVESQVHLYGHTEEVTGLFVCETFSILISVSKDGTCILWDLNRLCYVQSLTGHKSPVTAVSASQTTGDIATACDSVGGGSDLRLWTVNGDLIGHVHCREIICSLAFSNQSEGVSVNVIAGGLENGVVRLWSTWDLKPVRDITFPKSNRPVVSLTYSCDGHHLYTVNIDGTVIAWCRRDQQRLKLPMFHSFLSNYAVG